MENAFVIWAFEEARNHFLNALEIDANFAEAYFQYALLLTKMGDYEEAKTTSKSHRN